MSDTPRTREETRWYETGIVHACFAAQLERELNAANERIKRLEEAGNDLDSWLDRETPVTIRTNWRQAKEAKP